MTLRSLALIVGIGGLAVVYALVNFYPAFPKSMLGWLAVFLVGMPFLIGLEFVGDLIFGAKHWTKCSAPTRVSLGVVIVVILLIATAPIIMFIAGLINS